jgi:hypothetical protein
MSPFAFRETCTPNLKLIMKKLLLALTALTILSASALFAAEECKKCSGADKNAACTCKSCDKDKGTCPKDGKDSKDAKPAPSTEKKN